MVYVIVGLLTTLVAYGVRLALLYPLADAYGVDLNAGGATASLLRSVSISVGWVAGVIFAFFANKAWVFRDADWRIASVWSQFGKFVASRAGTYLVELALGVLIPLALRKLGFSPFKFIVTVDADLIALAFSAVTVTVLNYILSKLLVFRRKTGNETTDNR